MSAFHNDNNNFPGAYDTDMYNVPLLLRDLSIQQQPEGWLLGKHERGFFGEEEMDLEEVIQQSASKRLRYSDEYNFLNSEFAAFSLQQAYPSVFDMENPFTPVSDSNQTSSFSSQDIHTSLSTEGPVSDHSEDYST